MPLCDVPCGNKFTRADSFGSKKTVSIEFSNCSPAVTFRMVSAGDKVIVGRFAAFKRPTGRSRVAQDQDHMVGGEPM
jgi:hypothetical protein